MTPNNDLGKTPIRILYGAASLSMLFGMLVLFTVLKDHEGPRPNPDYGVPISWALFILFAIGISTARILSDQRKRIELLEQRLADLKRD
ncbi:MAG: hypothetical protein QM755_25100 [Luteolibacter sp.]